MKNHQHYFVYQGKVLTMSEDPKNDLTLQQYINLLNIAKNKFSFITYENISFDDNFILWRHDIDLSLNRALKLAKKRRHCVSSPPILLICIANTIIFMKKVSIVL